ncbi:MAG: hypothetical protein HKN14_06700 [Marinicaulis sp.]|nr:hypothetical protein [Marinicaulis sp.]NNE40592.1 hypothetical protein [Marinicaulis sp.]NNL88876.1 hypothetical protein [Marinicaulis sp.]
MAQSDNINKADRDTDAVLREYFTQADVPAARDALKRDILADFDSLQREARQSHRFNFGLRALLRRAALAQAGALAGAGALGLAIGANMSATAGYAGPEYEFYALNETVSAYAALEEEEFAPWAME